MQPEGALPTILALAALALAALALAALALAALALAAIATATLATALASSWRATQTLCPSRHSPLRVSLHRFPLQPANERAPRWAMRLPKETNACNKNTRKTFPPALNAAIPLPPPPSQEAQPRATGQQLAAGSPVAAKGRRHAAAARPAQHLLHRVAGAEQRRGRSRHDHLPKLQ